MYQPYPSSGQMPEPVRPEPRDSLLTAVKLMYAGAIVSALSLIVGVATIGSLRSALQRANPNYTSSQLHTAEVAGVVFIVVIGLIGGGLCADRCNCVLRAGHPVDTGRLRPHGALAQQADRAAYLADRSRGDPPAVAAAV